MGTEVCELPGVNIVVSTLQGERSLGQSDTIQQLKTVFSVAEGGIPGVGGADDVGGRVALQYLPIGDTQGAEMFGGHGELKAEAFLVLSYEFTLCFRTLNHFQFGKLGVKSKAVLRDGEKNSTFISAIGIIGEMKQAVHFPIAFAKGEIKLLCLKTERNQIQRTEQQQDDAAQLHFSTISLLLPSTLSPSDKRTKYTPLLRRGSCHCISLAV